MAIQLAPLNPFGVRLTGVDLAKPVRDDEFRAIVDAFNAHAVIVFPDQRLDDDAQTEFSARWGALEKRPTQLRSQQRKPDMRPEVNDLSNVDRDNNIVKAGDPNELRQDANMLWHTDSSFRDVPAMASLLSARAVPPEGGETEFADMRAAWDALDEGRRRLIDGQVAEHSAAHSRAKVGYAYTEEELAVLKPALQPMVRTHPATGRKAIFVASHASHVVGWPLDKGRALIDELIAFATQPSFVYRHHWRVGDLVMWDNRCTLHRLRPFDVYRYKRIMRRTTVAGAGPTVIDGRPIAVG